MRWRSLLLGAGLALMGLPALAATNPGGENITASPTQILPELAPGGTAKGVITIINDGTKAYDFKGYTTPYHVSGEDYDPTFAGKPGGPGDASTWFKVGAGPFHSTPGQTTTVPYTLTVPAGTGGGGYYATLFFETIHPPSTTGVTSNQRVGIVAYVHVTGSVTQKGSVEGFTAGLIQPGPPLSATLRLANQGNVHYTANVTAHVTDLFGHSKADIHVVRQVLPQTTRRFDLRWDKAPRFGLFRINGTAAMLGRTEVLPTRYVLVLSAGAFIVMSAALLTIVVLAVWWWLGRIRRALPHT